MKLRIRSLESKDTLKLDVPNPCSLPQLRQILADRLSPSPGSSFRLSLNRTDELQSPNPADSLQSLGLASGDLVYYSLNPDSFASRGDNSSSNPNFSAGASNHVSQGPANMDSEDLPDLAGQPQEVADSEMADLVPEKVDVSESTEDRGNSASGSVDFDGDGVVSVDGSASGSVDFDGDGVVAVDGSIVVRSKFSEPYFLRRVLREELGGDGGDHRLLVIAVHAVMQESGFVAVDPVTGIPADRFHLPDQWPSRAFTISLQYSLPVLVAKTQSPSMTGSVVLKFQSLGHFITVYGSLAKVKSGLRRICLDECRFAPIINVMWTKGGDNVEVKEDGSSLSSSSYYEKGVFEFWKIVKDGLALPLLIDLTERAGLPLPSCFTCLPTELKLKIFELLPGTDLARAGGVCSEFRYLTSNNELWKQKYVEEFGGRSESRGSQGMINWKQSFGWSWEAKKKRKRESSWWQTPSRVDRPFYFRIRRDPNPFVFPAIIGGDYDRLPGLGVPLPFGQPFRQVPFRRNVTPNCNLGGLNG